jgi:hypothetical protein
MAERDLPLPKSEVLCVEVRRRQCLHWQLDNAEPELSQVGKFKLQGGAELHLSFDVSETLSHLTVLPQLGITNPYRRNLSRVQGGNRPEDKSGRHGSLLLAPALVVRIGALQRLVEAPACIGRRRRPMNGGSAPPRAGRVLTPARRPRECRTCRAQMTAGRGAGEPLSQVGRSHGSESCLLLKMSLLKGSKQGERDPDYLRLSMSACARAVLTARLSDARSYPPI